MIKLRVSFTQSNSADKNFQRNNFWYYPLEAVREVFFYTLAHRDWRRCIEIKIRSQVNRFEVISPGAVPNSMTVNTMTAGHRSPRNPIIRRVLRDYGYVDYRGMGIRLFHS